MGKVMKNVLITSGTFKIRSLILIFLGLLLAVKSFAQDPQFSQYYASPLYLNPGFAGTGFSHRLAVNSRIQWPSLPQAFITHLFSWDMNQPKFNSGFGVLAMNDKAGSVGLSNSSVGLVYAYKLHFGRWVFSPGIRFAYHIQNVDRSRMLAGDQIEFGGGAGTPSLDPAINNVRNVTYFDFDFGGLIYSDRFWFGAAVSHLNEPNASFIEDDYRLPMKITAHAGMKIPLNTGIFASERPTHIAPSFVYKVQDGYDQLDLGINYYYQPVNIGIWYRGVPIERFTGPQNDSYISHDALIFLIGFAMWNFEFNYSYDFTISQLGIKTNGAHEFSLIYQFQTGRFKRMKEKHKPIPCPAFYNDNLNINTPVWMRKKKDKSKTW
jgi:type IX secretion system PorP/SprF family membrane protein